MYIRAAQRKNISKSIFSSTFLVASAIVVTNALFPCPVDHPMANEDRQQEELRKNMMLLAKDSK